MECIVCNKEYESKRATSKYCSSKCRKLAFHKNGKVSVPVDNGTSVLTTLTDACGNVHNVDFEERMADVELLKSWAKGRGYRRLLGHLALGYSIINGYVPKEG